MHLVIISELCGKRKYLGRNDIVNTWEVLSENTVVSAIILKSNEFSTSIFFFFLFIRGNILKHFHTFSFTQYTVNMYNKFYF